jgi:hypothetical protein
MYIFEFLNHKVLLSAFWFLKKQVTRYIDYKAEHIIDLD